MFSRMGRLALGFGFGSAATRRSLVAAHMHFERDFGFRRAGLSRVGGTCIFNTLSVEIVGGSPGAGWHVGKSRHHLEHFCCRFGADLKKREKYHVKRISQEIPDFEVVANLTSKRDTGATSPC
jgi:hypothetical protein